MLEKWLMLLISGSKTIQGLDGLKEQGNKDGRKKKRRYFSHCIEAQISKFCEKTSCRQMVWESFSFKFIQKHNFWMNCPMSMHFLNLLLKMEKISNFVSFFFYLKIKIWLRWKSLCTLWRRQCEYLNMSKVVCKDSCWEFSVE